MESAAQQFVTWYERYYLEPNARVDPASDEVKVFLNKQGLLELLDDVAAGLEGLGIDSTPCHDLNRDDLSSREIDNCFREVYPHARRLASIDRHRQLESRRNLQTEQGDVLVIHDSQFHSVSYKADFQFTAAQAKVLQALVEEDRAMTDEALRKAAGSVADRLRDIFRTGGKMHPAWGSLIREERKGWRSLKGVRIERPQ